MGCNIDIKKRKGCSVGKNLKLNTYEDIVQNYLQYHKKNTDDEREFYSSLPDVISLIRYAGSAKTYKNKRHSHQYRLKQVVLNSATLKLNTLPICDCKDFQELHQLLCDELLPICGIGPLMVYDTAVRIGFYFGFEPEYVYLHAGTKEGAKNLGFNTSRDKVHISEFPEDFQVLKPNELEDCLCIYKTHLTRNYGVNN